MAANSSSYSNLTIGVLALQGAFEEHQKCLESLGCKTVQVKTPAELENIDGIVFPGGESTAMGLIGHSSKIWESLQEFSKSKPTWGTCAGMVLLATSCVGASAVIENGQSLIGGLDILVCRNYFGSQISSFEMATPCPPGLDGDDTSSFPGVFIRAPAILSAGEDVTVLGRVNATPCRLAGQVLKELDAKVARGEKVIMMSVEERADKHDYIVPGRNNSSLSYNISDHQEEKKMEMVGLENTFISLPGAAEGTEAREVICAVRKQNILCTAFHPELTKDLRWHQYFLNMVLQDSRLSSC